jgi:hypothetical protein
MQQARLAHAIGVDALGYSFRNQHNRLVVMADFKKLNNVK